MNKNMLMEYYGSFMANQGLHPEHGLLGLWPSRGTSQGGYKRGHSLKFLAEAGGEQMAPDDN